MAYQITQNHIQFIIYFPYVCTCPFSFIVFSFSRHMPHIHTQIQNNTNHALPCLLPTFSSFSFFFFFFLGFLFTSPGKVVSIYKYIYVQLKDGLAQNNIVHCICVCVGYLHIIKYIVSKTMTTTTRQMYIQMFENTIPKTYFILFK